MTLEEVKSNVTSRVSKDKITSSAYTDVSSVQCITRSNDTPYSLIKHLVPDITIFQLDARVIEGSSLDDSRQRVAWVNGASTFLWCCVQRRVAIVLT